MTRAEDHRIIVPTNSNKKRSYEFPIEIADGNGMILDNGAPAADYAKLDAAKAPKR